MNETKLLLVLMVNGRKFSYQKGQGYKMISLCVCVCGATTFWEAGSFVECSTCNIHSESLGLRSIAFHIKNWNRNEEMTMSVMNKK